MKLQCNIYNYILKKILSNAEMEYFSISMCFSPLLAEIMCWMQSEFTHNVNSSQTYIFINPLFSEKTTVMDIWVEMQENCRGLEVSTGKN